MPKAKVSSKTETSDVFAIVGSDESTVKREAKELAATLTPADSGEFGSDIIDGAFENVDGAVEAIRSTMAAIQTLPFFGGKLVWLKNVSFLSDSRTGSSASVQEALQDLAGAIAEPLPPNVRFLISAIDVDKRRSFYKTLTKRAEIRVFDKLDASRSGWEEDAAELVRRRAADRELRFEPDALDLFVLLTGGDARQIDNELEKLELFAGAEKQIRIENVRALVPLSRNGVIFELSNALSARDLGRALKLVRRLLDQGESAIGILLASIVPTVRNLLLAKDLMERHRVPRPSMPFTFGKTLERLPGEATAHLPRNKIGTINAFGLGFAAQNAHRFETRHLVNGMQACLEANVQLVSSQLDHRVLLTELMVKLLGD